MPVAPIVLPVVPPNSYLAARMTPRYCGVTPAARRGRRRVRHGQSGLPQSVWSPEPARARTPATPGQAATTSAQLLPSQFRPLRGVPLGQRVPLEAPVATFRLWAALLGEVTHQVSESAITSHPRAARTHQLPTHPGPMLSILRAFAPSVEPAGGDRLQSFVPGRSALCDGVTRVTKSEIFSPPWPARVHQLLAPPGQILSVPRASVLSVEPTGGACCSVFFPG